AMPMPVRIRPGAVQPESSSAPSTRAAKGPGIRGGRNMAATCRTVARRHGHARRTGSHPRRAHRGSSVNKSPVRTRGGNTMCSVARQAAIAARAYSRCGRARCGSRLLTGEGRIGVDRLLKRRSVLGLCLALAGPAWRVRAWSASVAPVAAENGMVVTAQHLASQVGVDVLKRGGNAVDAAVAVGYALAVVYPAAGNLGGGGFMTIQLADGKKTFLDFRERAPLAATANMYLDAAGNVIKGSTTTGHLAVAVPGSVAGLEAALAKYGTMNRADLIAPAIRLAEEGFVLDQGDADLFATATEQFKVDPATTAIFLKVGGQPYVAGDRLVQKDLGQTLRQIREAG